MKYTYFASYYYLDRNKNTGFGQSTIVMDTPIINADKVIQATEIIQDRVKFKKVVILNFILLSEEENNG